ncbi:hypothetical protein DPMN_026984 [Dreissena polymorpha]|uniref:Uncharacterized protein n=1 Tax=Dreissena polymorpha TaxID=45954 RepID=A0A9D4LTX6_DREPO|nr:hypothetical protein DPMN_026984 [Dreissena polymorpha]
MTDEADIAVILALLAGFLLRKVDNQRLGSLSGLLLHQPDLLDISVIPGVVSPKCFISLYYLLPQSFLPAHFFGTHLL